MARTGSKSQLHKLSLIAGMSLVVGLTGFAVSGIGALEDSMLSHSLGRALKEVRANDAWMASAIHKVSAHGESDVKPVPAVVRPLAIGDRLQLGTHGAAPRAFRVTEIRLLDPGAAKIDTKDTSARLVLVTCLPADGANETPIRLVIEEPTSANASLPQSL